jgi:hypothetical protein
MMGRATNRQCNKGCHEDFQLRGATQSAYKGDNGAMDEMDAMISSSFEGEVHTLNRPHAAEPTTEGGQDEMRTSKIEAWSRIEPCRVRSARRQTGLFR